MLSLYSKYKDLHNWKLFLLTAFIIKLVVLSVIITLTHHWNDIIIQPDDGSYFIPVDNYLSSGHYSYDMPAPFAGRMPGYSLVYMLFRIVLAPGTAVIGVAVFQFLFSCVAAYVLCLISYRLFQNVRVTLVVFFIYCLSTFPAIFELYIAAESLSNSAFIISLYFLIISFEPDTSKSRNLIISGLFLAWAIFLRPYLGIFIILFPCFIIYNIYASKLKWGMGITYLFLFCLPFGISELAWIGRNYNATHRFIPLEDDMDIAYGKLYSSSWLALDNLAYTWGEDAANFDAGSIGSYFRHPKDTAFAGFPGRIFHHVTTYNKDSLLHLKDMYMRYLKSDNRAKSDSLDKRIVNLCALYKQDYISHNYISYLTYKPATSLKRLIWTGGYRYIQSKSRTLYDLKNTVKLISAVSYWLILILGCTGLILCAVSRVYTKYTLFFFIISLSLVLTIIFYSEIQEPRYFVHVFSLLIMYAGYTVNTLLLKKIKFVDLSTNRTAIDS